MRRRPHATLRAVSLRMWRWPISSSLGPPNRRSLRTLPQRKVKQQGSPPGCTPTCSTSAPREPTTGWRLTVLAVQVTTSLWATCLGALPCSRSTAVPRSTGSRAPRAWLDATEALSIAAARRDADAAGRALARAAKTIDQDNGSDPPPWPWVFPFDHAKLAWYRALVAVRLNRPADALAAFTESLSAVHAAPKQRALVMLEVATAAPGR